MEVTRSATEEAAMSLVPAAADIELKPDVQRDVHTTKKPLASGMPFKIYNIIGVAVPFLGTLTAMVLLWGVAFNWLYFGLMIGMYIVSGLGITIGYHRLFTHKSFETNKLGTFLLGAMGSMATEGAVIQWCAVHRRHHQHSDDEMDPHSPYAYGGGNWGMVRGALHAHVGWMLREDQPGLEKYIPDLARDPVVKFIDRTFGYWILIGLLIPAVIAGLVTQTWTGFFLGALWGGLVRIFLTHHITWSINSVCHIWGSRPFESHDESRNNAIFGILAFGEGWHNNHHAFPTSARHGLAWWQFDSSYLIIKFLGLIGMAWNIRVPTPERMESKRRKDGDNSAAA